MTPAPIALFAFNRPEHLARVLSALQKNPLATSSEVHIFSDGPRHGDDAHAVKHVREVARSFPQFGRTCLHEREDNLGLAESVIKGVTELSASHGRVIVLEDDLVVAPGFLTFMNEALRRYEEEPRVMQISGYMFPVERPGKLGSTFFCGVPTSWGWATWDRAWKCLNLDSGKLVGLLHEQTLQNAFNVDGAYPYFEHLRLQAEGKMDVWGVRWYASMFVAGGLCLYPGRSLVQNIGMDGSGVHCGRSTDFEVELSDQDSWRFPDRIEASAKAYESIRSFLLGLRGEKKQRTLVDLVSRLGGLVSKMKRSCASAVRPARIIGE